MVHHRLLGQTETPDRRRSCREGHRRKEGQHRASGNRTNLDDPSPSGKLNAGCTQHDDNPVNVHNYPGDFDDFNEIGRRVRANARRLVSS